jgi:hypothetical protein
VGSAALQSLHIGDLPEHRFDRRGGGALYYYWYTSSTRLPHGPTHSFIIRDKQDGAVDRRTNVCV